MALLIKMTEAKSSAPLYSDIPRRVNLLMKNIV